MSPNAPTDDLATEVVQVIAATQHIPVETISFDSTFEQLKIDSLDGINIVFALENRFHIDIPNEGLESMRSVREVIEGVRKLVDEKSRDERPESVPSGEA